MRARSCPPAARLSARRLSTPAWRQPVLCRLRAPRRRVRHAQGRRGSETERRVARRDSACAPPPRALSAPRHGCANTLQDAPRSNLAAVRSALPRWPGCRSARAAASAAPEPAVAGQRVRRQGGRALLRRAARRGVPVRLPGLPLQHLRRLLGLRPAALQASGVLRVRARRGLILQRAHAGVQLAPAAHASLRLPAGAHRSLPQSAQPF